MHLRRTVVVEAGLKALLFEPFSCVCRIELLLYFGRWAHLVLHVGEARLGGGWISMKLLAEVEKRKDGR